jgi:hypothetical protein
MGRTTLQRKESQYYPQLGTTLPQPITQKSQTINRKTHPGRREQTKNDYPRKVKCSEAVGRTAIRNGQTKRYNERTAQIGVKLKEGKCPPHHLPKPHQQQSQLRTQRTR